MTRIFISVLFVFLTIALFAQKEQEVVVSGEAKFAKNQKIRLVGFSDYITWQPQELASAKVAKDGSFKLSFKSSNISLVQLSVMRSQREIFLTPGYSYQYNLEMDNFDAQAFDPSAQSNYLQITDVIGDTNDINIKINYFNRRFESILAPFAREIALYASTQAFDSLVTHVVREFPLVYNPDNFYYAYIYYTIADIERMVMRKSPRKIYDKYLNNDHILYNNPAYMVFFNAFYDNYLYNSPRILKSDLEKNININPDYVALFNAVGRDFLLVNERLREFVIIKNLGQFLYHNEFDVGNVIKLLHQIENSTHFPEHKRFIFNILQKFNKDSYQEDNPDFIFKTPKGRDFKFSKLKGKPIYVQVFRADCPDCIREMKLIEDLKKKYGDKVDFVSVSVDIDVSQFEKFCMNFPEFDWTFIHFNDQYAWLDYFEINSLPDYYMLSEEGKMEQRYVSSPLKGLAQYFQVRFFEEDVLPENPMFRSRN